MRVNIGELFIAVIVILVVGFTSSMVCADGDNTTSASGFDTFNTDNGLTEGVPSTSLPSLTELDEIAVIGTGMAFLKATSYVDPELGPGACGAILLGRTIGTVTDGIGIETGAVSEGDRLGAMIGRGYDGSGWQNVAGFTIKVDGPVSTDSVPARFVIETGTTLSNRKERLVVKSDGKVGIGTTSPTEELDVIGTIQTEVLKITGGSDLSEQFDINKPINIDGIIAHEALKIKPGMVVCIDPENPGKLLINKEAYDTKVAGIISGAGGVRPGMLMGQKGSVADGKYPVALTGRVFCYTDATKNSIQPGDLLTTSDTPGHAMKVTEYSKAHGAILGKAMSPLENGKGLVLVLVTLQ